jgi:hypothetical protein
MDATPYIARRNNVGSRLPDRCSSCCRAWSPSTEQVWREMVDRVGNWKGHSRNSRARRCNRFVDVFKAWQ